MYMLFFRCLFLFFDAFYMEINFIYFYFILRTFFIRALSFFLIMLKMAQKKTLYLITQCTRSLTLPPYFFSWCVSNRINYLEYVLPICRNVTWTGWSLLRYVTFYFFEYLEEQSILKCKCRMLGNFARYIGHMNIPPILFPFDIHRIDGMRLIVVRCLRRKYRWFGNRIKLGPLWLDQLPDLRSY